MLAKSITWRMYRISYHFESAHASERPSTFLITCLANEWLFGNTVFTVLPGFAPSRTMRMIQTPGIDGRCAPKTSASILEDNLLDVYEVMREKEIAIAQIRREVEALRLVCQMLEKEGDSIPSTLETSPELKDEHRENSDVVAPDSERQAVLASIRARLADAEPTDPPKESRSVVVQFRDAALGASRALLKRVPNSRLFERKPQQSAIRNLFERFGRNAA